MKKGLCVPATILAAIIMLASASAQAGGINAVLNYFLIPEYGLMGAAVATAVASTVVSAMYLIEIYLLMGVHLILKRIYKPYVAVLPGIAVVTVTMLVGGFSSIPWKMALAVVVIATSLGALFLLGVEEEDKKTFFPKRAKT